MKVYAFPLPTRSADPDADDDQNGMELRDYFAGQVISQCQITVNRQEPAEADPALVKAYAYRYAKTAYAIADALLAERAKEGYIDALEVLHEAVVGSMEYLDETIGPCEKDCDCLLHSLHDAIGRVGAAKDRKVRS